MSQDHNDKTVLLSQNEQHTDSQLTTRGAAPGYEQLEDRMIFAAKIRQEQLLNIGINPLVESAGALLGQIAMLKKNPESRSSQALREQFTGEIKTFEYLALSRGCDNADVMAARYVLCTALDEAVTTTPWGDESEWSQYSLLSAFHNETSGGEKVFRLLDKLCRNPARHINLLELIYLCLSLGFEGKYRVLPRGMLELDAIRDSLFRQIRMLRGDLQQQLSPNWQGNYKQRHKLASRAPVWLIGILMVFCLGVVYGGFSYVLNLQSQDVDSVYQPIVAVKEHVNNESRSQ